MYTFIFYVYLLYILPVICHLLLFICVFTTYLSVYIFIIYVCIMYYLCIYNLSSVPCPFSIIC